MSLSVHPPPPDLSPREQLPKSSSSFYLKASDPAKRSWVVKFQICALYTVLRCVSAVVNVRSPLWHALAFYTAMTEALHKSSSLCSYSSLLVQTQSSKTRKEWPLEEWGDKRPPSWGPEILISHHHSLHPKKCSRREPPCMLWSPPSPSQNGPGYPSFFKSLILLWQGAKPTLYTLFLSKPTGDLLRTQWTAKVLSEK